MKILRWVTFAVVAGLVGGCATHVSPSKRQQVELATKTGPYAYQRAISPPGPMR